MGGWSPLLPRGGYQEDSTPATKSIGVLSVKELNQVFLPFLTFLTLPLLSVTPDHSELGSSQENAA